MARTPGSEIHPRFFRSLLAFREWLHSHHHRKTELWLGLYKRESGKRGISYKESVDAALCFGWIDGIRKRHDAVSYKIRFTPRRRSSIWSAINLKRMRELVALGLVAAAGLRAFRQRDPTKQKRYSFENRPKRLPPRYLRLFQENRTALAYYRVQPAWYQRTTAWWVLDARQEETRLRRLGTLIECSGKGEWIGPLKHSPARPRRQG